ncbi:MBL fold metallo-hydrolase [Streptomyces bohaiensis]|uniref:MBL fold metallo-hydrolase n=1 Tax=Streptomyces bohaiensis TaxID=1431344 RepID=A0ABX1C540_9ACTN|nr:MBL fold metallo-hydrolase [Streptomyces bohaiensis]NJQ14331.1 MBL fold metallo-hydrolase [Streptomyces bohaiensis]
MLIAGFPAGAWGTNCYLVAPAAGEECVVIDPGHQAADAVAQTVEKHGLKPVAALATHGHIDHVASVTPLCGARDIPAWIHPEDRYMLGDPEKALGRRLGEKLMGDLTLGEPDDLRELADGTSLRLAGLEFVVSHTPGHTPGSVTFGLAAQADVPPILFTGDLLFAGSIGRTDLPGGDHAEILRSLDRVCRTQDDATVVLAGHGTQTTIGHERATNPFLQGMAAGPGADGAAPPAAPRRGM